VSRSIASKGFTDVPQKVKESMPVKFQVSSFKFQVRRGKPLNYTVPKSDFGWIRPGTRLLVFMCGLAVAASLAGNQILRGSNVSAQSGTLATPANLNATDNAYATKVAVTWDAVRGATLYRVFRNTTNNGPAATSIGTTAQSTFFDATGAPSQTFFYWVRAENGNLVSALSQSDQGSRTGGTIVGPLQPLDPPPAPLGNQLTAAKAYLGKALFWDEQLSSTRTVACGTCHFATSGGSDARAIVNSTRSRNPGADGVFNTADDVFASPGVISNNSDGSYNFSTTWGFHEQVTGRKSRSYIDAGYSNLLFWDGRATGTLTDPIGGGVVLQNGAALESQVLGPPVSSAEMANVNRNWNDVAVRVSQSTPLALSPSIPASLNNWIDGRSYSELFEEAFGTPEVTPARIAMAIATFERTVYSDRTPFDQAVAQITPLGAAETRGRGLFNQVGCAACHAGNLFSDNAFHNIGVRPQLEDTGRFQVTGNTNNIGEFRTPSLRNVALRGPYFHNGHFATLEEVVEFYNRGGDFDAPNINHNLIRPLNLSAQQKSDLVAFLRALTDPRVASATSPFDRPVLYSESGRVPQITGSGTAGAGGNVPQVTAIEPPIVGNPAFTVAVSNALGGAQAVLVINSSDPGAGPAIPQSGSLARLSIQLSGSGAGNGSGSLSLPIPNAPGSTFFGRWYVTDSSAVGGVSVSPTITFTIFGESAGPNPIDDVTVFVRQQYRDFLNREPDSVGLQNWINTLTPCPNGGFGEIDHPDCDRVHVSMGFFQSTEFLGRGYFGFRFYMAALGQRPTYQQFTADMSSIGGPKSPQEEEQAETNFAEAFVQRPEFVARYGSLTDATQYVDALLQSAGLQNLSIRSQLISGLQNGTKTRGRVLREIVETQEALDRFLVDGFVAIQYFGYLHRDPDTVGYDNWTRTLREDPNNIRHMVFGFLYSTEYRSRFGTP
jgi:cytochrome c peroxidase